MPLTREQRVLLANALAWSRSHGWQHDVYPNTWRTRDGVTHVRYDSADEVLVVSHLPQPEREDSFRCRVAMIPADSPEQALRVLAALGYLPVTLGAFDTLPDLSTDDAQPDVDAFDGPASFAEAGQAFADLVDGRVQPDRAAEALSTLAQAGLIVSAAYHDEAVDGMAEMRDLPLSFRALPGRDIG